MPTPTLILCFVPWGEAYIYHKFFSFTACRTLETNADYLLNLKKLTGRKCRSYSSWYSRSNKVLTVAVGFQLASNWQTREQAIAQYNHGICLLKFGTRPFLMWGNNCCSHNIEWWIFGWDIILRIITFFFHSNSWEMIDCRSSVTMFS